MNGNPFFTVQIDYVVIAAGILCMLPAALTIAIIRREIMQRRADKRHPFEELKRRPAGESLRLKIESIDQKIDDKIMLLIAVPAILMGMVLAPRLHGLIPCLILLAISLIWTLSFKGSLTRLLEERRTYRLGFDGERYVGEELSRLIAHGFEIFHDVPFDGFNMDHVLVGRQGVFVVETKTRSKPVNKAGDKEYQVVFDGKCLHWPWGQERQEIQQAIDAADTFSKWLSKAVGEQIQVFPILTLPGWWVDPKGFSKAVYVLNPKQIIKVCGSSAQKFEDTLIKRICYQLDQKCRVEVK